jgi:endoglucanase
MNAISRRQHIQFGLGTVLFPLIGWAAVKQTGPIRAESYLDGGMKGFAIDSVEHRGNDVAYFDALAGTGANVARVFFPFKKCQSCTQFGRSPANVTALRRILNWAHIRKIKIVVVGIFDDQDKPSFWHNPALRESFVANWEWFATTFQNDPGLAGLDLMNEPNPPRPSGTAAEAHAFWRPLAESAITAIRTAGVTLPIIFEGFGGGQAIGLRDFQPFNDSQVVYSFHLYTPHEITHQRVGSAWPRTIPYPAQQEWQLRDAVLEAGGWDRNRLELALKDVIAFQQRYKLPIYVGEFSCVRWAPNGAARRYIGDCLAIFRKYGWSWCYHEFRGWPGWDAEIPSEELSVVARSLDAPTMALLLSEIADDKR